MATIATTEPLRARAGDTWVWSRSFADYPAGTWTLKYRFKSALGGFEIVAAASGADHLVTNAASASASLSPGRYAWQAWVEAGSEVYTVGEGTLEVLVNLRAGAAGIAVQTASVARQMVDALQASYLEYAKSGALRQSYSIAGRQMVFKTAAELIKELNYWKAEVAREEQEERLRAGMGGSRVLFRL